MNLQNVSQPSHISTQICKLKNYKKDREREILLKVANMKVLKIENYYWKKLVMVH